MEPTEAERLIIKQEWKRCGMDLAKGGRVPVSGLLCLNVTHGAKSLGRPWSRASAGEVGASAPVR